ncbi:hypothetical protein LCGC14_1231180 [marine sediment metagenome]|uniref:Methyltransferase domain-containing protein n=1 Tax=marine sediment metagenome TaxID=412755 RepID=A0A0F9NQP4_9ZZZZ
MRKRWQILTDLLRDRPHTIGAEIGVFEGDTTEYLLRNLPGIALLICVDPFIHYHEQTVTLNPNKAKFHDADFEAVLTTFLNRMEPHKSKVSLRRCFSTEAVTHTTDASLDWAFIDGNHAYEYVRTDIELWLPKIKPGGMLSGHDYKVKGSQRNFGVTRAVHEIFGSDFDFQRHVWYHNVPLKTEIQ